MFKSRSRNVTEIGVFNCEIDLTTCIYIYCRFQHFAGQDGDEKGQAEWTVPSDRGSCTGLYQGTVS